MKPEFFFKMSDSPSVMLALIESIPTTWEWVSGELHAPGYPPQLRLVFNQANFSEYRRELLCYVKRGYRGGFEVCHSAYNYNGRTVQTFKNPACVDVRLGAWIGTQPPEMGWQPGRIHLSWNQLVKSEFLNNEYRPVIDEQYSGRYEHISSIVQTCRQLGLREYEVIRASDFHRNWQAEPLLGSVPSAIAAE